RLDARRPCSGEDAARRRRPRARIAQNDGAGAARPRRRFRNPASSIEGEAMKRLAMVLALLACASFVQAAEKIRYAYPAKSLNYLPLFLGKAEGIDLELVLVTSRIQVTALTTGDLEFSGAQSQVSGAAAVGFPVKVIGFITVKPTFWLTARPEIRSISDLKGKIIGIT